MRFYKVLLILTTLTLFAAKSYGDDKSPQSPIFLDNISSKLEETKIYAEIRNAFLGRRWRVMESSEEGVTAKINHRGVKAQVRIYLSDDTLLYQCEGTREIKKRRVGGNNVTKKSTRTVIFCPEKWIENLRQDTEWLLSP